jgi:hypothetical protein
MKLFSFLVAACDPEVLNIVSKAGHECSPEKSTNESEGKLEQKCDATFETIFKISKQQT